MRLRNHLKDSRAPGKLYNKLLGIPTLPW